MRCPFSVWQKERQGPPGKSNFSLGVLLTFTGYKASSQAAFSLLKVSPCIPLRNKKTAYSWKYSGRWQAATAFRCWHFCCQFQSWISGCGRCWPNRSIPPVKAPFPFGACESIGPFSIIVFHPHTPLCEVYMKIDKNMSMIVDKHREIIYILFKRHCPYMIIGEFE